MKNVPLKDWDQPSINQEIRVFNTVTSKIDVYATFYQILRDYNVDPDSNIIAPFSPEIFGHIFVNLLCKENREDEIREKLERDCP